MPPAQNPEFWEVCGCDGLAGCAKCDGQGRYPASPWEADLPWLDDIGELLRVRALIERHGYETALRIEGIDRLSEEAIEGLDLIAGELARIERERARERAEIGRRRAREAKRGHRGPK